MKLYNWDARSLPILDKLQNIQQISIVSAICPLISAGAIRGQIGE